MWKDELEKLKKLSLKKYNYGFDCFAVLLAKEVGVTKKTVYNWLKGTFEPRRKRKATIRAAIKNLQSRP